MGRAIILVLDSFGIGATADAERFGDAGSDTFGHIARERAASVDGPLRLPNLARLGLFHAGRDSTGEFHAGAISDIEVVGAYGFAEELSSGKDTPSGHWEIAGVPVLFDWGYFTEKTNTFPQARRCSTNWSSEPTCQDISAIVIRRAQRSSRSSGTSMCGRVNQSFTPRLTAYFR
jgi:phosphopentomutase